MNQPEQPIEALLDEVENRKAYQYGTMVNLTVAERDHIVRELRQRIEREQRATTPSIVEALQLLDDAGFGSEPPNALPDMIRKAISTIADLRQQLERQLDVLANQSILLSEQSTRIAEMEIEQRQLEKSK